MQGEPSDQRAHAWDAWDKLTKVRKQQNGGSMSDMASFYYDRPGNVLATFNASGAIPSSPGMDAFGNALFQRLPDASENSSHACLKTQGSFVRFTPNRHASPYAMNSKIPLERNK